MSLAVFVVVYLGMVAGGLPRLLLDRTGVALLGALVLLASGEVTLPQAVAAQDVPTLALLFAFMVISAQLRLGGFYAWLARRSTAAAFSPAGLLLVVVLLSGALAAVFSNDVVCLAVAPVLVAACRRRGLRPLPFLLVLACAANVGSAATLIGNPQNMLVGQALQMSFGGYLRAAALPVSLGLLATWGITCLQFRGRWQAASPAPVSRGAGASGSPKRAGGQTATAGAGHQAASAAADAPDDAGPPLDPWQAGKGLAVVLALLAAFLFTAWPRELVALGGAGVLLLSRRLHSRDMLALVDGQLLVLFSGLFIVNAALQATGAPERAVAALGLDLQQPGTLFLATVLLSNVVSNVPAVMLLLPFAAGPGAGAVLALASTLAGNLLVVGSIANIIVVEEARRAGVPIGWRQHARTGVPVTLATLAIAAAAQLL